jgi:asparagine synthase (glutamine-hydrolysing)
MCGLTGFIDSSDRRSRDLFQREIETMCAAIRHRGPDDAGTFIDAEVGVALGFRRLSIIDLSPAGHQPMTSASGRYSIVFNGEVYNYERLREELGSSGLAQVYRGHSDTEVILACIEAWGLPAALKKFIGMFAFALWDRERRTVSLVRDRVGVKPMYYGWVGNLFLFGSELKGLRAHSRFEAQIDRDAVALMLQYGYVPVPHTIYKEFRKVVPGTILEVSVADPRATSSIPYWSAEHAAEEGQRDVVHSETEALQQLETILRDAVGLRMISDVPLGVFLSGGIDSSIVTALMQAQSARPVRTFTIGFHEGQYDEAGHAAAVARHLGTDHTELYITPAEAQEVIPLLPQIFDEPHGDSSGIPTYLVSKLARRDVTVALSGDGGDELFAGYNRHRWTETAWNFSRRLPSPLRRTAGAFLRGIASPTSLAGALAERLLPADARPRLFREKVAKLASLATIDGPLDAYSRLVSQISDPNSYVIGSSPTATLGSHSAERIRGFAHRIMLLDLLTYLPDDILAKVDRASMAVSLEAREPLLDHRLIEYAWRLPLSMKIREGKTKWALRQILYHYVPADLIDRPKMGFSIPLDVWLRTGLRDWAESLLSEDRLRREGVLASGPVRALWSEHASGRRDVQHQLWNILMFQAWLDEQRRSAAGESFPSGFRVSKSIAG